MRAEDLYVWKNSKKFCVTRLRPDEQRDYNSCVGDTKYKRCNSFICVKKELDCPITEFTIDQNGDAAVFRDGG